MTAAATAEHPVRWLDDPPINGPESDEPELPGVGARLAALAARARADLHLLRHPEIDWLAPSPGPDGVPMLDVLVVGAGQGGLSVAAHLIRERVTNIRVIDAAPRGAEGIWNSHGRMPVIRSPKHYPGPDMGVPSLTYESWHRTVFGDASWDAIDLVPVPHWIRYLCWIRETLDLPVENETRLVDIRPAPGCLAVDVARDGMHRTWHVRRLVLATGHDGTGTWWMPEEIAALPGTLRARAADPIDFAALAGRRVAVLGVGATAGDSALCAAQAGADVHMFCRRDTHRRQQVYRWCITAGFLRHFKDLDDSWRWRFMHYILNIRMGMPPETWNRLAASPRFTLHTSAGWKSVAPEGSGVRIETGSGPFLADFIISCTGHDQDLGQRPELATIAGDIALWSDRYTPPDELADERLARYPYLGPHFEFLEKRPGTARWLARIHDFTFGPTMSFGPSGCSISTLRLTVPMLVAGVTRGLFLEDVERHWRDLQAHPDMIP